VRTSSPNQGESVPFELAAKNQKENYMKQLTRALALTFAISAIASLQAQQPSPKPATASSPAKRTDIYHVFVVKAALGKAKELTDWLKEPDPQHPETKGILLRHQDGDSWDFVAIEHMGTKATVEINAPPMTPQQRMLSEWHSDTFVAGPPWSEFAKQLGLDGDSSKTAGSVYVVSDYRAAPGHRDELEKMLSEPPNGATDTSSGNVLLAHLEGSSWNFLAIARYDSWEKFAENEKNSVAQMKNNDSGWFTLRAHASLHHDTITDRIMP